MDRKLSKFEIFMDFCNLACPQYSRERVIPTLKSLSSSLNHCDGDIFSIYSSVKRFVSENPNGLCMNVEIERKPASGMGSNAVNLYKRKASRLIKEKTKIEIPASSAIPSSFYEAIIDHLIAGRNQNGWK